jgi:hypothetical protein
MRAIRTPLVAALAAVASMTVAAAARAAPSADLWPRWQRHDPASAATVDHSAWDRFLARYVQTGADGVNRVGYGRVAAADRSALSAYVANLTAVDVDALARREQLAFWINLYNALTVRVILDHYPVDSIQKINISPGFFAVGPWGKQLVTVAGEALSLDDIEHRILRPIWRDPRVHYAVNCASIGCPNLRRGAYTGANVETALDEAARAYVNHPRGAAFEREGLFVSAIYKWFIDDFGGTSAAVLAHLRRYADPPLAARLASVRDIAGHRYDWALNDTMPSS